MLLVHVIRIYQDAGQQNIKFTIMKNKNYEKMTTYCSIVTFLFLKQLKQRLLDISSFRFSRSLYSLFVLCKRTNNFGSYVYWTVHHLDSWIKRDQLDITCFIISLFNAQHVSDVNTSILRSLRLICWVISWVLLL